MTSMHTTPIRATISQAAVLPHQVLMPSIACRTRTFIADFSLGWEGRRGGRQGTPSNERCLAGLANVALERGLGARTEIVIEHHLPVDHRVLLPAGRAPGEGDLRLSDFLE